MIYITQEHADSYEFGFRYQNTHFTVHTHALMHAKMKAGVGKQHRSDCRSLGREGFCVPSLGVSSFSTFILSSHPALSFPKGSIPKVIFEENTYTWLMAVSMGIYLLLRSPPSWALGPQTRASLFLSHCIFGQLSKTWKLCSLRNKEQLCDLYPQRAEPCVQEDGKIRELLRRQKTKTKKNRKCVIPATTVCEQWQLGTSGPAFCQSSCHQPTF